MAIGIQRVTTEGPFTVSVLLTLQDSETPIDPDGTPAACSIAVTHVNGTVIVAAGTPATRDGVGAFHCVVPPQPPSNLVVTWSYLIATHAATTVSYVVVMGAHYLDLSEVRALDGLSDASIYPTAMLVEKRDDAESLFEMATGTYWTPHYVRDVLDGDPNYRQAQQVAYHQLIDYIPSKRLILRERYPRSLLSLSLAGVLIDNSIPVGALTAAGATFAEDAGATRSVNQDAGKVITVNNGASTATVQSNTPTRWTFTQWDVGPTPSPGAPYRLPSTMASNYDLYSSGELEAGLSVRAFPRGIANVVVEYLAGENAMPADLRLALKRYVRYLVLNTNARIPDRATALTTEFGTYRLGQATAWERPTGISEIDSVIQRYGFRVPSFA